jgi:hypothetical protein
MSKVRFSTIVTNPGTIDAQTLRNKMNEDNINKQFKKNREGLKRRRSVLTSPVHSLFMGSPMSYGTSEHGTLSPVKMTSFLSPTKKTGGKGSQKKRKTRSNRRTRHIR